MPLSQRMPDIAALDLLLSVAELGSLGRAAAAHGISQPSASSKIHHLERLVGVPLLERTPRGSRLTSGGALVADWAKALIGAAEHLEAGLQALREERAHRIRVAASLTVAEYLLPRWLLALRRQQPQTAVSLTAVNSIEVAAHVKAGTADMGFIEGLPAPEGLQEHTVASDRLVLVVAPTHPWVRRHAITAAELSRTALISREPGSGTRSFLEQAVRRQASTSLVPPLVELSSTTAIKKAVASGLGPAVLSDLAVHDDVAAGLVTRVPIEDLDLDRPLRAVWPTGQPIVGAARDLYTIAARLQAGSAPPAPTGSSTRACFGR
jgi:molybdate transport repressor ModE-like protein